VRPTKKEEAVIAASDTSAYFQKSEDGAIKCVSAALSVNPNTHIIISAPTLDELNRAWSLICDKSKPLDYSKTVQCLFRNTDEPVVEPTKRIQFQWFVHAESGSCFIEHPDFQSGDGLAEHLGPAILETVAECKGYLRKNRWPRAEIEGMEYNCDYIPF
jgi:hypothetical protein